MNYVLLDLGNKQAEWNHGAQLVTNKILNTYDTNLIILINLFSDDNKSKDLDSTKQYILD